MSLQTDIATAELLLQAQLDDIVVCKGDLCTAEDHNEIQPTIEILEEETRAVLAVVRDQRFARDLAQTELQDQQAVRQAIEEEQQALQDHELARQLQGLEVTTMEHSRARRTVQNSAAIASAPGFSQAPMIPDIVQIPHFTAFTYLYDRQNEKSNASLAGPRVRKARGSQTNQVDEGFLAALPEDIRREVLNPTIQPLWCVCQEPYIEGQGVELICEPAHHLYCCRCLVTVFENALKDRTMFPPRCCRKEIPLQQARGHLSKALVHRFEDRALELSTTNPVYCSQAACGKFIKPSAIHGDIATCAACGTRTCKHCKRSAHRELCPEDPDIEATLNLGRTNQWQRCYNCNTMVELQFGCNHITCPYACRAEFCYVCAKKWKTCQCPTWDEQRLLEVQRRHPPVPPIHVGPLMPLAPGRPLGLRRPAIQLMHAAPRMPAVQLPLARRVAVRQQGAAQGILAQPNPELRPMVAVNRHPPVPAPPADGIADGLVLRRP